MVEVMIRDYCGCNGILEQQALPLEDEREP